MRYGSVCSGIESASVAWRPIGWEAAFLSEIEKFPSAVLAHHYPDVPNLGDMTKFKEWSDAKIDVLVGGTPCQSFSVAGLRKGLDDPRGNLMLTYLGIVDRYRPKWVVWENVPGVLSSNGGKDFGTFLGALGELGYGWSYRVLDAQYFGVAQRRRRVFVVGHLGSWQPAAAVLFEQQSLQRNPAPSREKRQAVAALTASGVGTCGADDNQGQAGHLIQTFDRQSSVEYGTQPVASTVSARDYKGPSDLVAHTLRGEGFDASEDGTGRGTPLVPVAFAGNSRSEVRLEGGDGSRTGALSTGAGKPGQGMPCVAIAGNIINRSHEHGGNGIGADDTGAAYTLTGMDRHGVSTSTAVRRLTPVECERLQGFPDNYTRIAWRNKSPENCPDGPRYKALGNSMAVPVMRWIGERIEMVDGIIKER